MGVTACLLRNCLQWPHKRDFLDESDSEVGSYLSSHPTDADCRKFLYNQLGRVLLAGGIWAYLIFVTNPTNISVEKKIVMWRNFRFLCMTNVEISEISPHVG